ncbi:transcription initiation factor TFIIF subunit alpha [Marchantia polymorpha subsp. ruderalis]|uniref:Transcription initiation factor IIF subunit alpha n=2 Tax=Marchantia polymorpha TaxID=3197 RepID=A0AAF6AYW3_MARPO|nr:hypothetical protein MARPO_0105s0015 [Marchantia polymorpha]BBN04947.1 hypothetical protein Mp_3g09020 [Marchantia polymorpha subsp. ruderalis]|eukprot:PTQ31896.1 hypothetical protein MARPO_0105s0015 [Marchantia polymorpha]
MTIDPLVLKPNCNGCGTTTDLYGSTCKHMTICVPCGKSLVETGGSCTECGLPITRLIREYSVKNHVPSKQFFVGRFHQGIPHFAKKKTGETKWAMQKDGAQGRQLTDTQKEKFKLKPWILEDDIGVQQFTGQLEGGQQATYFLLIMSGNDFQALPAGNWYNFHKVAQYKQLTLEEAEEQMKNRRKTADGYQRWMMKAANTGAAAFGGIADDEKVTGGGGSSGRRKGPEDDDDGVGADSDKGEEDEDEEEARTKRLGLKNAAGGDEDGEEPAMDLDLDEEEPEKGDDWEHEETFTDDDEAVGNDPEERIDQENPEVPPPPEIKQEEEDEEEGQENPQEEPGGLSKSGKELKKLLGKAAKEDDSNEEEDEEDGDEDVDLDNEDIGLSPVLAPTRKDGPKDEPAESTPVKPAAAAKATPASASAAKGKRKAADESKANGAASAKKAKAEPKTSPVAASKKDVNAAVKAATTPSAKAPVAAAAAKPAPPANQAVTEDEVMRVLKSTGPIKSTDLVAKFRSRLRSPEDKSAFAAILKKISRIQKTDGANYIVLRY